MTYYSPAHLPKIRSHQIMQAPKNIANMGCQLRIASFLGEQCSDRATCVMAHNPFSPLKGMATKGCDTGVICACLKCHDILDGSDIRLQTIVNKWPFAFMEQVIRAEHTTRGFLIAAEIIVVPDGEIV